MTKLQHFSKVYDNPYYNEKQQNKLRKHLGLPNQQTHLQKGENKVSLQTNLERNPTNSSYIFMLSVNFENLTIRLHVLITSLMLTKFQENQRSIAISSNKC